jgi:hypothetical protein
MPAPLLLAALAALSGPALAAGSACPADHDEYSCVGYGPEDICQLDGGQWICDLGRNAELLEGNASRLSVAAQATVVRGYADDRTLSAWGHSLLGHRFCCTLDLDEAAVWPSTVLVIAGAGADELSFHYEADRASLDLYGNLEGQIMGKGGDDTITGSNNPGFVETLMGGGGDDTIDGMDGDDTLTGGSGDDILSGGEGDDVICGGADNDDLYGDYGVDDLWDDQGANYLHGGYYDVSDACNARSGNTREECEWTLSTEPDACK